MHNRRQSFLFDTRTSFIYHFKMIAILQFFVALVLILQVFIGLTYFISSIWEKENRASVFAGNQFAGMLTPVGLFFIMDDVFYGKKPKPKSPPTWAKYD